jgi:hypothetical protein
MLVIIQIGAGTVSQTYDPRRTAVLLVDPYNDFLSEGGKIWPRLAPSCERWDHPNPPRLDNLPGREGLFPASEVRFRTGLRMRS